MSNLIFKGFSDGIYIMEGIYATKKAADAEKKRYKSIGRKSKIKVEVNKSGKSEFVLWLKD
jgi:hypothetical protein